MAPSSPSPPLLALPSTRATQACQGCRKRKARCINFVDGACQLCREKGTVCEMAPNMAKDRAAQSRARNEENELLRQHMGLEGVQAILQGSSADSEAALLTLGRVEGRIGGIGPAGCLEDLKRVCHRTINGDEWLPDATDARLLAILSTDTTPDAPFPPTYDELGFDADGRWVWSSGTVPAIEAFDQETFGTQWLPSKVECDTHIDFFFASLHALMPLLSEVQFRRCFAHLWDESGQRGWKSWFPWTREESLEPDETAQHRAHLDTQIAQFIPVLFAVLACAASAASGANGDGARYHALAIWNLHYMATHARPVTHGPPLHQIQVMALLSNHLASLGHLPGAWTAFKYGAELLRARGLHLNANHGQGVDAEIRRRTFWCLFNLDRTLGRILGQPFQISMPLTGGCALPLGVDEGTEQWTRYFDRGELLPADLDPASVRIAGWIVLCQLEELASRIVKDLYPPTRDRSQDWRFTGVRSMLEAAIEDWNAELGEIEDDMWQAFGDHELGAQEHALEQVVRNLAQDVRLLIYRVQLPRSSQRAHRAPNSFSLEPQVAVAQQILAVPVTVRADVPRSVYSVQETVTVFLALFPLLHQRIWDAETNPGRLALIDRDIGRGIACLQALASSSPVAAVLAEAAVDLARLLASQAARAAPATKPDGRAGSKKKPSKKPPPKLENISKGKAVLKTEPNSAGFPQGSSAMVDLTLNSPRIVSPRAAARFQPYPQSPPGPSAHPYSAKVGSSKVGGRPRARTFGGGDGGGPGPMEHSLSRSGPRPLSRYPPPGPFRRHSYLPTEAVSIPHDGPLSDTSFSLSPREPRTPPGLDSAAEWSSPDELADRGRRDAPDPGGHAGYSPPLSLGESPRLPAQPLGYDDGYDLDEEHLGEFGHGPVASYPPATYAIPGLHSRASYAPLDAPSSVSMAASPGTPASFPGYDRFATSLAFDRSRQASGYAPWDLSHADGAYRPMPPPPSSYRPLALAPSFAYPYQTGASDQGYGFAAGPSGAERDAYSAGGGPPAFAPAHPSSGRSLSAPHAAPSAAPLGQHPHPSMFQHQNLHHHRRR